MEICDGVLIVNKPKGVTSHDVVSFFRKKLDVGKVGHAGTLDPLACGVLIILIGDATKRQKEFMDKEKEYVATACLGATSTTDDAEGEIRAKAVKKKPTFTEIKKVLKEFIGEIDQVPPSFSAVKINGQRAYKLARGGKFPKIKARKVNIYKIEMISYKWPTLKISVVCSSGTYIRALARDIGKKLGCGAYLMDLERTRSGNFRIENSLTISS